jgi:hypothetical protein
MQTINQNYSDIMLLSKSRSPRLYIVNYFDLIINQIDITAESALNDLNEPSPATKNNATSNNNTTHQQKHSNEAERNEINKLRDELIREIKKLEQAALANYDNDMKTNIGFYTSVNDGNGDKLDSIDVKTKLFSNYCILIDKKFLVSKYNYKLGLLIVLDWYLSETDIKILK